MASDSFKVWHLNYLNKTTLLRMEFIGGYIIRRDPLFLGHAVHTPMIRHNTTLHSIMQICASSQVLGSCLKDITENPTA